MATHVQGIHRALALMLIGILLPTGAAYAETIIDTDVTTDTTWDLPGSPYLLTTSISVRSTSAIHGDYVTLTIEPAVQVVFQSGSALTIGTDEVGYHGGALRAEGTELDSIFFTSEVDEEWGGIQFLNSTKDSRTTLDYCSIKYGSSLGSVRIDDASPSVSHSSISDGYGNGILITGTSLPSIYDCTVSGNAGHGLLAEGGEARPTAWSNQFTNNTLYALSLHAAAVGSLYENMADENGTDLILLNGDVQTNATWPFTSIPYHVSATLSVKHSDGSGTEHALLTIDPEVVVAFAAGTGLVIGTDSDGQYLGAVAAIGTSQDPVVFTSDEAETTKTAGYWAGISCRNGSVDLGTRFEHCVVEYAGSGGGFCIGVDQASPAVVSSELAYSSQDGMLITGDSEPTVSDSWIHGHLRDGLHAEDATARPGAEGNTFEANAGFGLRLHASGSGNLGLNIFVDNGDDRIGISGTVNQDVTWPAMGVSYHALTDIQVMHSLSSGGARATLTLLPGTQVEFAAGKGLEIGADQAGGYLGALDARGTELSPIIFTSAEPESTRQAGDWKGLWFRNGTVDLYTLMERCVVEYGGYVEGTGVGANIEITDASPTVVSSVIRHSSGDGVILAGTSHSAINTNVIEGSGRHGLFSQSARTWPHAADNEFLSNSEYPINIHVATPTNIGSNSVSNNGVERIALTGGTIEQDATWPNTPIPYHVLDNTVVQIPSGGSGNTTLLVEPGTLVEFAESAGLEIGTARAGALQAVGTPDEPIHFTSIEAPGGRRRGYWRGLFLNGETQDEATRLAHLSLTGGGSDALGANLTVQSVAPAELSFLSLTGGPGFGLKSSQGRILPQHLTIEGNSAGGYEHSGADISEASVTWWGDSSGPSGEGPGGGQSVGPNIVYEPWAAEPLRGNFFLSNVDVSPKIFNPNGGAATFQAQLSEPADWEITIRDSSSAMVRTFSGSGGSIDESWDGHVGLRQAVEDGEYTYVLAATSVANPERTASLAGRVTVNTLVPLAAIASPTSFGYEANEIPILGTAADDSLLYYVVEYGVAEYPLEWTIIAQDSVTVVDGLLAVWDATGVEDPRYTLRLTVWNQQDYTATHSTLIDVLSVYDLMHTVSPFSPNGDHVLEESEVTAELTHEADWTLYLRDEVQAVRRTISGYGTSISAVWDGKDGQTETLPDGPYAYEIQIFHAVSGSTATSHSGEIVLDNTPPFVEVTSIPGDGYVSGAFDILGTADDLHFVSYAVMYGAGESPGTWTTLQSSTSYPVVDSVLAHWSVFPVTNGDYTLRVEANDLAGNEAVNDIPIVVDNIRITDIRVAPVFFNPHTYETSDILYTLDRACDVTIELWRYDNDSLIHLLLDGEPRPSGENAEAWDGRGGDGQVSALDVHIYKIFATNALGRQGRYDPVYTPGGVDIWNAGVSSGQFDPFRGDGCIVDYDLLAPAWTTIKVGVENAADPTRTLTADEPRRRWGNAEEWDGRTDGGGFDTPGARVVFAWTTILPENAIVLQDLRQGVGDVRADPYAFYTKYGGATTISYTIGYDGLVTLQVRNPADEVVRTLEDNEPKLAGTHSIVWDGKDDEDRVLSTAGDYGIIVSVADSVSTAIGSRRGNVVIFQ
ncbi:right-handed parallel beta-helix repeat-containing protein [Candidatus Eisenbacteria bacterium]|uniref:Right-handed parallel beta-helix repeat-containing protein n=1 Tax=Eiseniibacteriota bacterium TaxID=2212470 RepID=A0ABV6YK47_UNCEI